MVNKFFYYFWVFKEFYDCQIAFIIVFEFILEYWAGDKFIHEHECKIWTNKSFKWDKTKQ